MERLGPVLELVVAEYLERRRVAVQAVVVVVDVSCEVVDGRFEGATLGPSPRGRTRHLVRVLDRLQVTVRRLVLGWPVCGGGARDVSRRAVARTQGVGSRMVVRTKWVGRQKMVDMR